MQGVSINTIELKGKMYPLIHGGDAPNKTAGYNESQSRLVCDSYSDNILHIVYFQTIYINYLCNNVQVLLNRNIG